MRGVNVKLNVLELYERSGMRIKDMCDVAGDAFKSRVEKLSADRRWDCHMREIQGSLATSSST